jgi:hypothetical protein
MDTSFNWFTVVTNRVARHAGTNVKIIKIGVSVDDRIWGVVLIATGLAMFALHPWAVRMDSWLRGLPNDVMTAILVLLAIIIICIAFGARPAIKALLILWIVMP